MPSFGVSKYREGGYDRRLMHHVSDRSWITNPDPDHPKGTHPKLLTFIMNNLTQCHVSADNLFTTLHCYVLFVFFLPGFEIISKPNIAYFMCT